MKENIKRYFGLGCVLFLTWLAVYYWPAFVGGAGRILSAAGPLIYGAVVAYVVGILMGLYEKHLFSRMQHPFMQKLRGPVCMVLAFVTIIAVVFFLIKLVIPQLFACFQLLVKEIPPQIERLVAYLESQEDLLPSLRQWLENARFDWDSIFRKGMNLLSNGATGLMTGAVATATSIIGSIPNVAFTVIFAMYMLLGKHTLLRQVRRLMRVYLKPETRDKINYVMGTANTSFRNFIIGQVTEALIIGALCTAGMMLLRLPYAAMTGAVIGFTALIPVVGAYIGTFVGAFMIFTVSPVQALVFVIFLLVLQQIEGNLIYPHTVGNSIGLPGIWVLAAVTVCGGLFGVAGMLIGVPAVATLYRLLEEDINRRDPQSGEQ